MNYWSRPLLWLGSFLAWAALAHAGQAPAPADPLNLPAYAQEVDIALPQGAQGVSITATPLYRDAKWAVTQRWDDNLVDSLRVRDLLKRYHMHGTFYLNASDAWYFNESGYRFDGEPKADLAKALRQGGNSIGGHTLTHNFVPMLNRQEQFYEMLGVRIDREVNSQSPLSSFVFPFTVFRNALEGDVVHLDIAEELKRAGYLHVSNQYFNLNLKDKDKRTGILDSWLLPCDGEKGLDSAIKGILKSEHQRTKEGNFCFCMHAWPHAWGGPALPNLDANFKHWKGREPWWYANENELGAYRYQMQYGEPEITYEGKSAKIRVRRFEGWAIGDNIPLTIKVAGFGQLTPTAHYDGQDLHLRFKAKEALEDLRVTWRIPLGWDAPPPVYLGDWPAGQSLSLTAHLGPNQQALASQGRPYFAAQFDFMRQGQRVRLYSDCRGPEAERDPQFPKGGFLVMGPLPGDRKDFSVDLFASKVLRHKHPVQCQTVFEDQQACWEVLPAARLDPLHPELIPAGAVMAPHPFYTWDPSLYYTHGHKLHYMMAGVVESPVSRTAKVVFQHGVRRLYVNGKRVRWRKIELKAGPNLVTMLYRAGVPDGDGQGTFSEKNYGTFFRITDDDGKRLTDIQYHMPDWLEPVTGTAKGP